MNEANPTSPGAITRFAATLAAGRFAITAEIAPPVTCDPDDVVRKALPLKDLADAVNVKKTTSWRMPRPPRGRESGSAEN